MAATRSFLIDGAPCSLASLLAANSDDVALCDWARSAAPGDRFPAIVECVCAQAQPHPPGLCLDSGEFVPADQLNRP